MKSLNLLKAFSVKEAAKESAKVPCKGLIFSHVENNYIDLRGNVVFKTTMQLRKRLSCSGCDQCGYLWDELNTRFTDSFPVLLPTKFNRNSLFKLEVSNISRDYESGYIEDYDLEFIPYTPPEKSK